MRFVRELEVTYRRLPLGDNSPWIGSKIASSRDVSSIFRSARIFDGQIDESCWIVMVAGDNRVLGLYRISEGGPTDAGVYPAKVFRGCILSGAVAFIMVHNHPSGSQQPSAGDRALTQELVKVGDMMRIPCLDHVILPNDSAQWYSFADNGLIQEYRKWNELPRQENTEEGKART